MSVALYYPSCATPISDYACSPCPPKENGRVRSVAFVKNTYKWTDPSNPVEWATAIQNQNAIVIWQTQGSYDGGNTTELTGFGDTPFYNGNAIHTLTFKDPNFADNCDFYNDIKGNSDYTVIWRTSSLIWLASAPVVVTPKNPVADDINSVVTWDVIVKWAKSSQPCSYATPAGIFDRCYIV